MGSANSIKCHLNQHSMEEYLLQSPSTCVVNVIIKQDTTIKYEMVSNKIRDEIKKMKCKNGSEERCKKRSEM